MIQFLSILKNPLTKMVLNKGSEYLKHRAEKVKTVRAAEIEAAKDVDITRIKSQDQSYKDEILMLWLIGMLTTGWFPQTRENFREWVAIINDLPDSVWYLVIIVFTASFGSRVSDKLMNRKKK
tara:strand:+ start:985 stop:1353 length:369 start_codon:yes stop_codon:yes gene_type:complete